MKRNGLALRYAACLGLWLAMLRLPISVQAAYYQPGDVVTNFVVYARAAWTNSAGFAPNAPMRLSDFAGKIIFVEFFDPT